MPTVTHSAELPGTPDQVWAVVSDFDRYGDWNVTHSGFPDGAPQLSDGTSFREKVTIMGMPGEATWTVKEVDAPNRLVLEGAGPMGVQLGQTVELTGDDGATTISFSASFDGGPLAGPMGAAVAASAEKAAAESVGKLRALLG
jgi:carbon monoxide dehydrogenase subunit G